jgi:transcriptional regulator with XRE-family HTH domain
MNADMSMALKQGIVSTGTGSGIGDNLAKFFSRFNTSNSGETVEEFSMVAELSSAPDILQKIKNSTGLSWRKIAELFSVSRRAVYDWLEGKPMSDQNYSKLCKVEEALAHIKYNTPFQARSLLLFGNSAGATPYQLLKQERYDEFSQFVQAETYDFEQAEHLTDISPADRLSALQDKVHTDLPGKRRRTASRRRPGDYE